MTMRAARWHGALDVRIDEVPMPRPGPDEVLVRIERAGICGTDVEEYLAGPVSIPVGWRHPTSGRQAPLTLGHELVGTVVETGAGIAEPIRGRVVPNVVVGCGRCWWCDRHQEGICPKVSVRGLNADGGLAEYITCDARSSVAVPEHVDLNVAAFAEPVAIAVRAMAKVPKLAGSVVAVVGAGVIGLLVTQLAMIGGAVTVLAVDPVRQRRKLASAFGAVACEPERAVEQIAELSDGRGADVVLECAGAPGTLASAIELSRPGAMVVLVGFHAGMEPVPLLSVVLEERQLIGSSGHLWDVDIASAVALLARGTLDVLPMLSAIVALSDVVAEGFERLLVDRDALKILVDPTGSTRWN
jgi:2-desacetyl-2-hydroxyethyl bacteriochlorophyllide A dehydrogenase